MVRPSEGVDRVAEVEVVVVMPAGWPTAPCGFLTACARRPLDAAPSLRAADGRQHEHEAAAGSLAGDDVSPARARQAPREREPQPGGALPVAVSAHTGVEDALAEPRIEAGAVVPDGRADAPVGGGQL